MGNCARDGEENSNENEPTVSNSNVPEQMKLLLLGAGDSGKSTILRQIRILHVQDFSHDELLDFRGPIHINILEGMRALVEASHQFEIVLDDYLQPHIEKIETEELTADVISSLKILWKDEKIQQVFKRANEFQIHDSTQYFFENLERITSDDYVPTHEDIFRARIKTTGIVEVPFEYEGVKFILFDVGGQRNERKKWIHCFQNVNVMIFCASLSEYDQMLYEDHRQNRMYESLMLFGELCNSRWFVNSMIILFLNKKDIFEKKIQTRDLKMCFPEYDGGCDYDNATAFITEKFKELNKRPDKKDIYVKFTCATDRDAFQKIFDEVKVLMLKESRDI
ncbi:guanine nucleotide-binding protein g(o) subunit alpha [Anaeramoeba ignava]|uniref:Guanine nucleotide-binding protein g(O) subunit alpha n=1 Tax=Anaeramoeba ignava TaxID=1746090 RepID=A0A9Q0L7E1_ANAIG|nr:guanine nucleotide-binding protein g(o) subunit alpha [Anaeramoeba ignava]